MASWFDSLKAVGNAAAAAAATAAQAAADYTQKTYKHLSSPPSEFKCTACETVIPVPAGFWDWRCPTPACVAKAVTLGGEVSVCPECKVARVKTEPPKLPCPGCGTQQLVPQSNFGKHVAVASSTVQKAAVATKEYAVQSYNDAIDYPKTINCDKCQKEIQVPAELWEWKCPKPECKAPPNGRDLTQCAVCHTPKPALPPPTVKCEICETVTPVPTSNFRKGVGTAAVKTKAMAANAGTTLKSTYKDATSAPVQFNCQHCTQLLEVPNVWVCQKCQHHNSRSDLECKGCHVKWDKKPEDDQAICGKCGLATTIPSTNLANVASKNVTALNRGFAKLWYNVAGQPFVTCENCGEHVPLPEDKAAVAPAAGSEKVYAKEVRCKACGALNKKKDDAPSTVAMTGLGADHGAQAAAAGEAGAAHADAPRRSSTTQPSSPSSSAAGSDASTASSSATPAGSLYPSVAAGVSASPAANAGTGAGSRRSSGAAAPAAAAGATPVASP